MNAPLPEKVALAVNSANLIRALRDFFTSTNLTFSTEALQNARRAGATTVIIDTYESEGKPCFRIVDDGCGITDWQALLTVAESSWSEEVMRSDSPYGIGFMSLLFAAERVRVASNGKEIIFASDHALSMQDIQIYPSVWEQGTVVEMFGLKKRLDEQKLIESLSGFPIQVMLNGKFIDRYHVETNVSLSVGEAMLPDVDEMIKGYLGENVSYYLQGMLIGRLNRHWRTTKSDLSVHLDSTKYFGRLPDRAQLIDHDQAELDISNAIRDYYLHALNAKRAKMGDDAAWAEKYWNIINKIGRHLLLEIDLIPAALVAKTDSAQIDINHDAHEPTEPAHRHITRTEVEAGEVELYVISHPDSDPNGGYNIAGWRFLKNRVNAYIIDAMVIPDLKKHWVFDHLLYLDDVYLESDLEDGNDASGKKFVLEVVNPGQTKPFYGRYVRFVAQNCDALKLTLKVDGKPDRSVEFSDAAFPTGTNGYGEASTVYFPADTSGYAACCQLSSYISDDTWRESEYEEDESELSSLIHRMRLTSPKEVFESILRDQLDTMSNFEELQGQSFTVSFQSGEVVVSDANEMK